jgi:hypothetical protein
LQTLVNWWWHQIFWRRMIIFNLQYVSRSSFKTATTCGTRFASGILSFVIFKCIIDSWGWLLMYIAASVEGFVELEMGARILSFTVG